MSSWTPYKYHRVNLQNKNTKSNILNEQSSMLNIVKSNIIYSPKVNFIINTDLSNNTNKLGDDNYYILEKNAINYCIDKYDYTCFSKNGKYAAILLESRFKQEYSLLFKQISRFLNNDWSVILYVTEDVYDNYCNLISNINDSIQIRILEYKLNNVSDYNDILLNIEFWNNLINYEKVLIFQTDTMIYRYGIEKFFKYDYIGAPWPKDLNTITEVGNGGFSLRSVIPSIICLTSLNKIKINNYNQYTINEERLGKQPEDIIFSYGMKQLGYNVPDKNIAKFFSIESVEFNEAVIGSHRIDVFNKYLGNKLLINSIIPYNLCNYPNISGHRFGWNFVLDNLKDKFINKKGVYFNTWVDCDYLFEDNNVIPNNTYWVGITHLTPVYFKNYYNICNINNLVNNKKFIKDLEFCKGLFTLSKYMKDYLSNILAKLGYQHIPVSNLYHPICNIEPLFNPKHINNINIITSIGSQLRKNTTLFKLNTKHKKIWLPGRTKDQALDLLKTECKEMNIILSISELNSVNILNLSNIDYDNILVNSFVIIDVYNASANNALIECISRNIPCFVSNLPAIKEYIGDDYPLLFNTINELEKMLENQELILSAYNYLNDRPYLKERLTIDNFIKDILNSDITREILTS